MHSIKLHQDANVFVSESDAGKSFELQLGGSRQAYLLCIEGKCPLIAFIVPSVRAAAVQSLHVEAMCGGGRGGGAAFCNL